MYQKNVEIKNESGLHARPGSEFVKLATSFESEIKLNKVDNPNRVANAKSLIFILSLGIQKGSVVNISASGEDEEEAVEQLVALIESGFGE